MQSHDPEFTINLRARDDTDTLYYRVSVTDKDDIEQKGFIHQTENYNEALIYAKSFYDELSQGRIIASYIEQPYRLKQGAIYSIGSFVEEESIVSEESFYNSLAEEFTERRDHGLDANMVFRNLVAKHKLDLYKESKFHNHLQEKKMIDKDDDSCWVE